MILAYTRPVSPRLAECELTHLERTAIDADRAAAEHAAYESLLMRQGLTVQHLPEEPDLPDAVFVEDAAIVLDEIAVITRPGAISRRPETTSVAVALARHRPLAAINHPATLDGGDVLVTRGRRIYVGLSSRTNRAGAEQLARLLQPHGYEIVPVAFHGCLHLKSGVTTLDDQRLLLNPDWVDARLFPGQRCIAVDPREPNAANALALTGGVVFPSQYPRTRERLEAAGLTVHALDTTELTKAEAGVTCCSLLVNVD